jgi:hypothetical protein
MSGANLEAILNTTFCLDLFLCSSGERVTRGFGNSIRSPLDQVKMRLLHSKNLYLSSFLEEEAPSYVILSHTWEEEEVTFDDLRRPEDAKRLKGWAKIVGAANLARATGCDWIWIDTCCIDKSSSAELQEAINSMFRWYKEANRCIAYLSDVTRPSDGPIWHHKWDEAEAKLAAAVKEQLMRSRWFTRGWTLQELIAPARDVVFYDRNWQLIGQKGPEHPVFTRVIGSCSGVPYEVLENGERVEMMSVAQRISWASERKTTRPEDMAYCLMGLFGIHMPLLYGEGGKNAFLRLQEEILRTFDDDSIFAWKETLPTSGNTSSGYRSYFSGLLASHPSSFRHSRRVVLRASRANSTGIPMTMTNRGLHMDASLAKLPADKSGSMFWLVLGCKNEDHRSSPLVILLQRVAPYDEDSRFIRARPNVLTSLGARSTPLAIPILTSPIDTASFATDEAEDIKADLAHPITEPNPRPIYVLQTVPQTKSYMPLRLALGEHVESEELPLWAKISAISWGSQNSQSHRIFSAGDHEMPEKQDVWVNLESALKNLKAQAPVTRFRFFHQHNPSIKPHNPEPVILAKCRLRLTDDFRGTLIHPESVSRKSLEANLSDDFLLLLGLRDPEQNPARTPPLFFVPWYTFIRWPGLENQEVREFPSNNSLIQSMTVDLTESGRSPVNVGDRIYLPRMGPGCPWYTTISVQFTKRLRRSTFDFDVKLVAGGKEDFYREDDMDQVAGDVKAAD